MFDYHPRRVHPLPLISVDDYRIKRYELSIPDAPTNGNGHVSDDGWRSFLADCLPRNDDEREHRVGFAMVHYARDGSYLLISRWYGGNNLKHEAHTIRHDAKGMSLEPLIETRITACVWELEVMSFERDAWVRTAMAEKGSAASLDSYLDTTFRGWV
jgi:hypothetical protein